MRSCKLICWGHRERFGVVPICRALTEHGCPIAPSTYYAARDRGRSARAIRDELVLDQVCRVHQASRGGLYGARKIYRQLRHERVTVDGLQWLGARSNG